MKILNIVDISLVKNFLSKFYLTKDIDYLFMVPHLELLKRHIEQYKPDLILMQSLYSDCDFMNLIKQVKEISEAHIIVLGIEDDSRDFVRLKKKLAQNGGISLIRKNDFVDRFREIADAYSGTKAELHQKIILYADDSMMMHRFIDTTFSGSGYRIVHAYNGREALEIYNRILPDLVITDIEMPVMDGFELCTKIKEDNKGRFIPVIVLSTRSKKEDVDTAFNIGADDYIVKPAKPEDILAKVVEYLASIDRNRRSKILIVDDSKVVSEIIVHAMLKNNLNVITASDGQEGFEKALKERPEVIITDIEMPVMNGYELCEKLKESGELRDTPVIMMSTLHKPSDIKRGEKLGISRYFTKPFDVEKLVIVVEQLLVEKYNIYKKEYEYMLSTIKALVSALEARDEYTKGHTERVSTYSIMLGKFMGLSKSELDDLEIASNLHDIGKIGVRDDILLKPGKLSDEEYSKIQEHAIIGAEILKPISSLKRVVPLILLHHERWDGRGYPTMIKEDEIPLGARIIAVADTFDAITSDRPYRKGLLFEKAFEIIKENIGTQFCPKCAAAFLLMMSK